MKNLTTKENNDYYSILGRRLKLVTEFRHTKLTLALDFNSLSQLKKLSPKF